MDWIGFGRMTMTFCFSYWSITLILTDKYAWPIVLNYSKHTVDAVSYKLIMIPGFHVPRRQ